MIKYLKMAVKYLGKLIQADSKESSKRFLALYATLGLMTYVIIGYTNIGNAVYMLGTLCSFVLALAGIGAFLASTKNNSNEEVQ